MLDKEEARKIAAKYAEKVIISLNPSSIILFGSYANGTPHVGSDIDIAVLIDDFKGDWYDTEVLLYRLRRNISFDIEPHLLDKFHDPLGFAEHVIKTGEVIYASYQN
ncbi:MAG: nucleotidyltransferase domain-containing protein [Oscillospiraceae bacterium]|jgi:predicted nucleotidyltransferase|nr:nucleotidyltransferase domain-containing protein [Oscillospiraceae bacterium]